MQFVHILINWILVQNLLCSIKLHAVPFHFIVSVHIHLEGAFQWKYLLVIILSVDQMTLKMALNVVASCSEPR